MAVPAAISTFLVPAATVATLSAVPSLLTPGVTSAINNTLGNIIGSLPTNLPYFFTVPFPNNQAVLYKLEMKDKGNIIQTFIFPLTPNNINKQFINLTNYYDVASTDAGHLGVQRIVDNFGLTPPIITISGTTGFQFHSLDNYQWSGRSSFAQLVQFIQSYNFLVASNVESGQNAGPLPQLLFTDGFTNEIFDVVPFSTQSSGMEASRPLYQTYNLQFIARTTTSPESIGLTGPGQDPIAAELILSKALLTAGLVSAINGLFLQIPGSRII